MSQLPELERLSPQDRARFLRDATPAWLPLRHGAESAAMGAFFALFVMAPFTHYIDQRIVIAVGLAALVAGYLGWYQFCLSRLRPVLRARLRDWLKQGQDPRCGCGYNLRGFPGDRCPRCGAAVPPPTGPG